MKLICCAFLFISYLNLVQPSVPRTKTNCTSKDPDCIVHRIQLKVPAISNGIPELGIAALDPMYIYFTSINTAGLNMDFYEMIVRGFRNAVVDKMNIDIVTRQIELVYHTDVDIKSLYKADGSILSRPFNGDGIAEIHARNLQVQLFMPFEISKNGRSEDVVDLKTLYYSFDVKDGARFNYTNLFYGNQAQSDLMHQFLNENWRTISKTYGGPVLDAIHSKIFNSVRSYLLSRSILDLFLN